MKTIRRQKARKAGCQSCEEKKRRLRERKGVVGAVARRVFRDDAKPAEADTEKEAD